MVMRMSVSLPWRVVASARRRNSSSCAVAQATTRPHSCRLRKASGGGAQHLPAAFERFRRQVRAAGDLRGRVVVLGRQLLGELLRAAGTQQAVEVIAGTAVVGGHNEVLLGAGRSPDRPGRRWEP